MSLNLPSAAEIGHALAVFGNYRVLSVQEHCWPYKQVPASVMLALGYRESALQNIVGGAVKNSAGEWVFSDQDAGWLQISRQFEADFLRSAEGCKSGQWSPAVPPVNALQTGYVPRFTPALLHVKAQMIDDMDFALANGVAEHDLLRFAIAAHNAGAGGALEGYRAGNVDLNTAHGDYSAFVLAIAPMIHDWVDAHPNWQYHHTEAAL